MTENNEHSTESEAEESQELETPEVSEEPAASLFLSPDDSEGEEVFTVAIDDEDEPVDSARVADLEAQVTDLQGRTDFLEKERDDFKNKMLRAAADLENFRKRTLREKEEQRKFGIDKVVLELLPVIDNLERALQHSGEGDDASGVVDGVRMVYRQFVGALEKHGVKGFEAKGEHFDPQRHEAIQQFETTEHETGTVLEQYQKGYFLHERLIRPALVSVAKKIEAAENEALEVSEGASDAEDYVIESVDTATESSDELAAEPSTGAEVADEVEVDSDTSEAS